MARVNPIFVENDGLRNQNQILLKQIESLSRQLDDAQRHVTILESQAVRHRPQKFQNRENSSEVRHVLDSIRSDWKQVVALLSEVEDEKRKNQNFESQNLRQKERFLEAREQKIYAKEAELKRDLTVVQMMKK